MKHKPARRRFLTGGAAFFGAMPLSGCFDASVQRDSTTRTILESANDLTYRVQRLLLGTNSLAQEFSASEIRQPMRPNGVTNPQDSEYLTQVASDFSNYRLTVGGMVAQPLSLSLEQLQGMPSRTQITRHDCVEGWSCIAMWTGTPLAAILDMAQPADNARYVVFSCFDTMESGLSGPVRYYESIDMLDARHPQTILAYAMNGQRLPVANGAPLRVRVERQLGYKMAKYIHTITLADSLQPFGRGNGGYWEDHGYEWFAGI
ncbi:molybdopterin-dependent oxidoreductase [Aureimonas fodinaquatilis]|uniref:Molybdopterin-dependent oxidoreductase n=1 Tax=Aureimonas fodinaquatilis TaxID=2565783 RepID=A0A5B0DWL3_9HYPH|nr:molybdopterin-binding protein [Aureimonas fodinaquatilis]KAA0970853.1 molybdopterin-dependent oxidoreductase [Aureimonas fodinaquatilis]